MISLPFPLSVKICWHWISGSGRFLKGGAREVRFVGQGGLIWGGGRSDWHLITAAGTLGKAWLWPTFGSKYPEVLQVGGQYQGVWGFGGYDDELSRRWWCCWWWWRWWSCLWLTRRSMQWEGRARLNSSKTRTTTTSTVTSTAYTDYYYYYWIARRPHHSLSSTLPSLLPASCNTL